MQDQLFAALKPVRSRQRQLNAVRWAVIGLLAATEIGAVTVLFRFVRGGNVPAWAALLLMLGVPLVLAMSGLAGRKSWLGAASAVDTRYGLQDRTVSALEFTQQRQANKFELVQIEDAIAHLESVDASEVVPMQMPDSFPYAVFASAIVLALLLLPMTPRDATASFEQPPGIAIAAEEIAEEIEELEVAAEAQDDEELRELVFELREHLEELKDPETNLREALASISEMQARISDQQAQYNEALVDAQLQSLSQAMAPVEAFRTVASALEQGKFDQAADQLEHIQETNLDRRESRTASDNLAELATEMSKAGLSRMSEATSKLSQACKSSDSDGICKACDSLSESVRQHGLRKSLNNSLASRLKTLSECKSMCQGGDYRTLGLASSKGGQSDSNTISQKENSSKSNRATNSAGVGSTDTLNGERTQLNSTRQMEQITGQMGEGPSDYETTNSPDGEEVARRGVRSERYEKYRKMSDTVLESEPIPLGQRQTIRRYFELIRPSQNDAIEE